MFKRFTLAAIISAIILSSSIIYTVAQQPVKTPIEAQPIIPPFYADTAEYSVKFVCGTIIDDMPLNDGKYHTAINIHNPGPKEVKFEWKVASHDGRISEFITEALKPDQAMEIDCRYIAELLETKEFAKGFVVIHQPLELQFQQLDISPVYTTSEETIVNKVWFRIIADQCTPTTYVFEAGIEDNFANGTESSSPSAALADVLATYPHGTRDFDQMTEDRVFGHTFSNLPENILAATLEVTLRAGITLPGNDSIALDYNNGIFSYGSMISDLVGSWNDNDIASLTLNLDNLPGSSTSILSSINADHALDIYIQDDTGIDFARLTVVACSIPDEVEELLNKDLL